MTVDISHFPERELVPPGSGNVPPDATIPLLQAILKAVKDTNSRMQTPADGIFVLSPDALSGNNGRVFYGSHKTRFEQIILLASGAVTFTIQIGSSAYLTLPATPAGVFTEIVLPFPYVMDRGTNLQILAGAATWAGYAVGSTE